MLPPVAWDVVPFEDMMGSSPFLPKEVSEGPFFR